MKNDSFERLGMKYTYGDIRFIRFVLERGLGEEKELARWYRTTVGKIGMIKRRELGVAVPEEGEVKRPNIGALRGWAEEGFPAPMPTVKGLF